MPYYVLANFVLVVHFAFIIFVVAGGFLALRWRWAPLMHFPAVAWGVFVELSGRVCPLTPLENAFRCAAGASGYSGGFLEQYLVPLIYPADLSRSLQVLLAALAVVANTLVYAFVFWHRRRATGRLAV